MNDAVAALRPELESGLTTLGLDTTLADLLLAYVALLQRWNQTYNLTAIRDPHDMLVKHLLDSLAMHAHLGGIDTLADLGTGPGLPGIPLAIARPRLQVTLVESNGKKARFLREVVRQLQWLNHGSRRSMRQASSTQSLRARWPPCR
jgi:16S rRNA (guanine527-N7)-methyltransferase